MNKQIIYLALVTFLFSCSSNDSISNDTENPIDVITLPELQTNEVTDITLYSVKTGGKLIDNGDSDIIEVGLVVGLTTLPTTESNLNKFILTPDDLGNFNITITSVPTNTTYFIRAYGLNSEGIGYGNEIQFTSLEENVYTGNITLSTQDEVNEFGTNEYTTIDGSMYIEGTVTDLSPLESIVIINNAFEVKNTQNLQNLKGLNNLKITGNIFPNGFRIENNSALESLSGLNNLEFTRGYSYIINNDNLINMQGLNSYYAASAGEFRIQDCDGLQNLSGLENLQFIGDRFYLINNSELTDLSSLSNLNYIARDIDIKDNHSLQNINGFNSLSSVESVSIINNDNLIRFDGLLNLVSLNSISIEWNDILNNLSGVNNVTTPLDLTIQNNNGLETLKTLNNPNINSLNISSNTNLISLEGLENVTTLSTLRISRHDLLNNLNGLNNLTTITENLDISLNYGLNSLYGLDNLNQINGNLKIRSNYNLVDFCALKKIFINQGLDGNKDISNNAVDISEEEIIKNCK